MKSFIVLALCVAVAVANPVDKEAEIIQYENNNIGVEGYGYNVKTSNGISAQEVGTVENLGSENEAIAVRGEFSYIGPDGVTYAVKYISDRNGFQPQGAHLPVAPN